MNMFKPVKATNREEYIHSLPPDRKEIFLSLDAIIRKTAPSLTPNFLYNMPGYGSFPYKNYKKEIINWPTISLANQKNYMSLYICSIVDGTYLAETYKSKLGNVSVGKSCIRFKRLADFNLATLEKVIKLAEKSPGLVQPTS